MKTVGWNQAVKFLYQQATKRDLAFDYLKDLSLGSDADTRIPLSADSLFWLHFYKIATGIKETTILMIRYISNIFRQLSLRYRKVQS